jgi:hypothetical protein
VATGPGIGITTETAATAMITTETAATSPRVPLMPSSTTSRITPETASDYLFVR